VGGLVWPCGGLGGLVWPCGRLWGLVWGPWLGVGGLVWPWRRMGPWGAGGLPGGRSR